jgi:hypothetical protein
MTIFGRLQPESGERKPTIWKRVYVEGVTIEVFILIKFAKSSDGPDSRITETGDFLKI